MGYADEAAFDDELTYYMHCCDAARAHYSSKSMQNEPVEIVVEIQYMLQTYFDMRKYTHTWYKIVRAADSEALVVDYNSWVFSKFDRAESGVVLPKLSSQRFHFEGKTMQDIYFWFK